MGTVHCSLKQRGMLLFSINQQTRFESWEHADKVGKAFGAVLGAMTEIPNIAEHNAMIDADFDIEAEQAKALLEVLEPMRTQGKITLVGYQSILPVVRQLRDIAGETE